MRMLQASGVHIHRAIEIAEPFGKCCFFDVLPHPSSEPQKHWPKSEVVRFTRPQSHSKTVQRVYVSIRLWKLEHGSYNSCWWGRIAIQLKEVRVGG